MIKKDCLARLQFIKITHFRMNVCFVNVCVPYNKLCVHHFCYSG